MAAFYNQATLSYNNTVTGSNIVTGELIETLSITKTALDSAYDSNDILAYAVSIVNAGDAAYNNVTVTDDLGSYAYEERMELTPLRYVEDSVFCFADGVLQPAPTVTQTGGSVAFSGITIPAQGSVMLIYEAATTPYAPLGTGQSIVNTAALSGAGIADALSAAATVAAAAAPALTISKSVSPSEVMKNSVLTYSFLIQNSGAAAAAQADNVSVTDVFDPVLTDLSVTLNGTPLAETSYSYDASTGTFVTDPGVITVPAATFTQDAETGEWTTVPGSAVLVVSGTV